MIKTETKRAEAFCITVILIFLLLLVKILYQPEATAERHSVSSLGSCWYQIRMEKRSPWNFHARF